jgi:hypothetical protein
LTLKLEQCANSILPPPEKCFKVIKQHLHKVELGTVYAYNYSQGLAIQERFREMGAKRING